MKNGFSIAALAVFLLSDCVSDRPQAAKNAYESDYERFFQNVIVKEKTPHYVTYEYKDVRIDEIAFLASRYCQEQGGKIYIDGFGWVTNHGGGGSGTTASDMYENVNKVGIME